MGNQKAEAISIGKEVHNSPGLSGTEIAKIAKILRRG